MSKLVEVLEKDEHIIAPEWAKFVKTGVHKQRPPMQDNWWTIRAASALRKVAKHGPIGVNSLAKQYGGRQNRGNKPDVKKSGSRNIVRKVLQQLEKSEYIKANTQGKAGKVITQKGKELLKMEAEK